MSKSQNEYLLWSAELPGHKPILIFGSIHLGSEAINHQVDKVKPWILKCNLVLHETDLSGMQNPPMDLMAADSVSSLKNNLSQSQYRRFNKYFKKITGIPLDQMNHLAPFFIHYFLLQQLSGLGNNPHVDQQLFDFATANNIPTAGIETVADHYAYIHQIDPKYHLKNLKNTLKNLSKTKKTLQHTIELYAEGKQTQLYKKSIKSLGKYKQILLYNRNKKMIHSVLKASKNNAVFVVVGLAHLGGQKGLLNGLKQAGASIHGQDLNTSSF